MKSKNNQICYTIWDSPDEGGWWVEAFGRDGKDIETGFAGTIYPTRAKAKARMLAYDPSAIEIKPFEDE